MSIYKNGKLIAGGRQCMPLLSFMWADHQLNDVSWLRADTFSWQSGAVYQAAYQHLADDIDGKTLQSETVGGTTIQFYLADDGHKICPASEESNVSAIYTATGVAWYYIIDTVNTKFKLPRTKFGFTGLRDTVGNYVEAGLPNITGDMGQNLNDGAYRPTGAFYTTNTASRRRARGENGGGYHMVIDASNSSSIYGNSTTVQPPATQMYLYFYIGNFTQTATENTAGLNTEMFNDLNAHKVIDFQEPTAQNNYTWYRLYADGWVEQGGSVFISAGTAGLNTLINLPVAMADTRYTATIGLGDKSANNTNVFCWICIKTTTNIVLCTSLIDPTVVDTGWQVSGIAA